MAPQQTPDNAGSPGTPMTPGWARGTLAWVVLGLLGAAALVAVLTWPTSAMPVDPVAWQADLLAARQSAADSAKPLLLDFTSANCGYCTMMARNVFPDPQVAGLIGADFVAVKMDVTNPASSASDLARQFGVQYLPTFVVLAPDGREVGRTSGYRAAPEFHAWLVKASAAAGKLESASSADLTSPRIRPDGRTPATP